jgi:bifunctional UDP-N-acetylglucosamine pyrophosphorylase/glucosamine-1-phosphate N-acetyltransferase
MNPAGMPDLCALILAAGKGTRMMSERAKVLHPVCGVPMLKLVYRAVASLGPDDVFIVIGQDAEQVRRTMEATPARFVLQEKQLGTGHAVMAARKQLSSRGGDVLILYGDTPRIRTATLRKLIDHHRRSGSTATLLTTRVSEPFGYGRVVRNKKGNISAIVEERDATAEQKLITEINPGFYCFQIPALIEALGKLTNDNAQKEYYLTDLIAIEGGEGKRVDAIIHEDFEEFRGINTLGELAEASRIMREARNLEHMASGVMMIDPDQTYIDLDVEVGRDVTLYPGVCLEGSTRIGEGAVLRRGCRVVDSTIGPGAEILDSSLITDSEVGAGSTIGPSAHLRERVRVGENCRIGNFVEIKKSTVGNGTVAAHLSYLGDAFVGDNVNIGAGTITCNFDGLHKNVTIIEDNAFVGTAAQLVAPVRIGKRSYVAAGSCITKDVPAGALAISRGRQVNKRGWVERRKKGPRKGDDKLPQLHQLGRRKPRPDRG